MGWRSKKNNIGKNNEETRPTTDEVQEYAIRFAGSRAIEGLLDEGGELTEERKVLRYMTQKNLNANFAAKYINSAYAKNLDPELDQSLLKAIKKLFPNKPNNIPRYEDWTGGCSSESADVRNQRDCENAMYPINNDVTADQSDFAVQLDREARKGGFIRVIGNIVFAMLDFATGQAEGTHKCPDLDSFTLKLNGKAQRYAPGNGQNGTITIEQKTTNDYREDSGLGPVLNKQETMKKAVDEMSRVKKGISGGEQTDGPNGADQTPPVDDKEQDGHQK